MTNNVSAKLTVVSHMLNSKGYLPRLQYVALPENNPQNQSSSDKLSTTGFNINRSDNMLKKLDYEIKVLAHSFNYFGQDVKNLITLSDAVNEQLSDGPGHVIGDVLCYPNPFRLSEGTQLGYRLSKDMDIKIQIYDMRGRRIFSHSLDAGSYGAKGGNDYDGYNKLDINLDSFDQLYMSSGVYILFLFDGTGKVMKKMKMAVLP